MSITNPPNIPTAAPATQIQSAGWNELKRLVEEHELLVVAPLSITLSGNYDAIGGISKIGGVPVSTAAGHAFEAGLSGFTNDTTLRIRDVRLRINQTGAADTVNVTLWEVDDTVNAPGTAIATVGSGAATGAKYVTLSAVNRPLLPGYSWYIRADHQFSVGAAIRYGALEVIFEPIP